jgi:hypothetical protein
MFKHRHITTQLVRKHQRWSQHRELIRSTGHCSGAAGQGRGGGHAELAVSRVTCHCLRVRIVQAASSSSICFLAQVLGGRTRAGGSVDGSEAVNL